MDKDLYNRLFYLIDSIKHSKDIISQKQKFNECKRELGIDCDANFGDYYYKMLKEKKLKGTVYTQYDMAFYVIENTIKSETVIKNPYIKILDPSCGVGNFIICIYKYLYNIYIYNLDYINKVNKIDLKKEEVPYHIIKNNLYGFDIDEIALEILKIDLWYESGIYYEKNFKTVDFLVENIEEKFDIVIGNPPYIGHKVADKEYVKKIKDIYKDIFKDKSDIYFAFFRKAFNILYKEGKVSFIVSRYILESKSGEEIRNFIFNNFTIKMLVDFYGIRPFKSVGIDPVIMFLEKLQPLEQKVNVIKPYVKQLKEKNNSIKAISDYKNFHINLNPTKGIWILMDEKEKAIIEKIEKKSFFMLKDLVDTYQGIITGCDKAFIVDRDTIFREKIEKDLIKPWIKSSNIEKGKIKAHNKYLIYSDIIEEEKKYPNAIDHIKDFKSKLINRRECKNGLRQWYMLQWGRKQHIFDDKKLIFPFKSANNRFAIDEGSYFSADIYAMKIKNEVISYEYLENILNSKIYEFYFKLSLKKLGENMYEYYPNKILNLKLPSFNMPSVKGEMLMEFFNITKEDYRIISEYIE